MDCHEESTLNPMRSTTPVRAAVAAAVTIAAAAAPVPAQDFQWPDEPENLEVLPDTIGPDGLRRTMNHFTDALGVQCSYCHVGEGELSEHDFASDDEEHKQSARVMMRMVRAINTEHLEELEHDHDDGGAAHAGFTLPPDGAVTCVTCHRGTDHPATIQEVLAAVVEREGVEAAVDRYRELREEFYGGFTYDFRVGPLSELARDLADRGRTGAAVRMAELEVEYHPESYRAHFVLAQVRRQAGDRQGALESMERALELAPEDARPFLERQLERIRSG